jgi:succinate dehydrogenase / fumarate reductase membrane anchor subunit
MVKTVLSVSHQGLREWIIQRLSAIYMALYSLGLVGYVLLTPGMSFAEWHGLFSLTWVKVATILFIFLMLYHAWIGMWTIFTDYVKPFVVRSVLNTLVLFMLGACFVWGLMIVWSV